MTDQQAAQTDPGARVHFTCPTCNLDHDNRPDNYSVMVCRCGQDLLPSFHAALRATTPATAPAGVRSDLDICIDKVEAMLRRYNITKGRGGYPSALELFAIEKLASALRATTPATAGAGAIALDRQAIIDVVMRETTDKIVADGWEKLGAPNVLVQGCRYVRGPHGRGYEDPEDAARKFAGFIADAILARARVIVGAREPHKIMTAEEYASRPLKGWHEVCRDWDGLGATAIRYLGEAPPAQPAGGEIAELVEALKPFAEVADWYDGSEDDNFEVWADYPHGLIDKKVARLVNFRRARDAMSRLASPGGGSREEVAELLSLQSARDLVERCAVAAEAQDRTGYEWVRDSLWENILKRAGANVRALRPSGPQAAEGDAK